MAAALATGVIGTPTAQVAAAAEGRKVTLRNAAHERIDIGLVTDFENCAALPHPLVANNVSLSNPFGIVGYGSRLYVRENA